MNRYLKKYNYTDLVIFILFILSPILSIPLIVYKIIYSKESRIGYIILFSLAMAFIAYQTVPNESDDLFRHFEIIKKMKNISFTEIFDFSYSGSYINTLLMYFCAKINLLHLYPAIYVGVGYYILLHTIIRLEEKISVSKNELICIVLFVLLSVNCRDFISGLRNYFSFILCFYFIASKFYFNLNNKIVYLGILFASFIHISAIIILFLVIFYDITSFLEIHKKNYLIILLFLPITIIIMIILNFLYPEILNITFYNKIYHYLINPNIINIKVYIFNILILGLVIVCHIYNLKREKSNINMFLYLYLLFMLSISPIMILLTRFNYFLIPISSVVFLQFFNKNNYKRISQLMKLIIGSYACVGILIICASLRAYPWYFLVDNIMFPLF